MTACTSTGTMTRRAPVASTAVVRAKPWHAEHGAHTEHRRAGLSALPFGHAGLAAATVAPPATGAGFLGHGSGGGDQLGVGGVRARLRDRPHSGTVVRVALERVAAGGSVASVRARPVARAVD